MSDSTREKTDCPEVDVLSMMVDGFATEDVRKHVAECEQCQSIVSEYRKLDVAIAKVTEQPPELVSSIMERIRKDGSGSAGAPDAPIRLSSLWRYAAGFVLTAALVATAAYAMRRQNGPGVVDRGSDSQGGKGVVAKAEPMDSVESMGNVELSDTGPVRPVNVSGTQTPAAVPVTHNRNAVAILPESIRHVWVVDNIEEGKKALRDSLPENAPCQVQALGKNRFSVSAQLQDKELQVLVDHFSKKGWGLVSADLPQPGHDDQVRFLGRTVLYSAELVQAQK